MIKTRLMGMIVIACASIGMAQSTDDYKKFEIFGGYSHNRVDTGIGEDDPSLRDIIHERESFHGFNVSVTGNLSRYFGLKGDFSGHFMSRTIPFGTIDSSLFNFLGGVQFKDNSSESTFKPFAHALVGAAHGRNRVTTGACGPLCLPFRSTETETGFGGAFGGGIDFRASNRVDIRAIQLDYNPTRLFDRTQHNFRIGIGLVFH